MNLGRGFLLSWFALSVLVLAAPGCGVEDGEVKPGPGPAPLCSTPVDRPADPNAPSWSYTGMDDGPEKWGDIPGFEQCGTGNEQTPIDIRPSEAQPSAEALTFEGYDAAIPLVLLNNGHTLQVKYARSKDGGDPRITYAGKTYRLLQLHGHSTSEHTVDGTSFGYELHFVHQAEDGTLAVVGLLFEIGAANPTLDALLKNDPGAFKETTCGLEVRLAELLPEKRGFYHYNGSLTTPACNEGVAWFVLAERSSASAAQVEAYQAVFDGFTNRPVKPLGGRVVLSSPAL